nr:integrase, catalytic region, zinc finger, CCHC-type, peptidase aspartic, catalytic [Tanacetum cinerariifolium]
TDEEITKFINGKAKILQATDEFPSGLHLPEVNMIINFDVPTTGDSTPLPNFEVYLQRAARCGKFGKKGVVFTMVSTYTEHLLMEEYEKRFERPITKLSAFMHVEEVKALLEEVIDNDIYSTVDACANACEMWKAIQRLKQGESINVQDLETNLFWEFGKFTSHDGESLESYYSRSYKMMNELIRNQCNVTNHQVNVQFLLQLQPEWQRFMTLVKQSQELKTVSYHKLLGNVAGARETVGSTVVQKSGIQYDTDDEFDDQELEAHYMYMAKLQEVYSDAVDSRPIFDTEPDQKVQNNYHYDVFVIESKHPDEQIDQHDEDADLVNEQLKRRDSIEYASEMELECVKVRGCYNDNLALMLTPESDEVIRLEKENQSKLSDLIRPFDYAKLNSLYDLFVPQRKKSSEQRYFSERSRLSHIVVKNGYSNESFNKQSTLLEKRMDESIPVDKQCLNAEMVADLRYFNSLELEVDSLISQLETQNTQFLNEIDRLSREYYYDDHMNAILGVYTELDEVTNLQCDYLELLEKYNFLEKELSKSNMMTTMPMAMPVSSSESNKSIEKPIRKTENSESNQKPRNTFRKLYKHVRKTCKWWYIKFTPSGYMWKPKSTIETVNPNVSMPLGNASRTANVLDTQTSRCSTVSNTPLSSNSFAAHRDNPIHRAVTIKRVYYIEGLNHNLFSVGQFCDADLEVAFRKSTCYTPDLKGNDLLTESCGTDLYSVTLQDSNCPNPIFLMAKATSSQAWLWHRRLSHLNFDTINLLSKNDIVVDLPKLKFVKDHLCSSCELGKPSESLFTLKLSQVQKGGYIFYTWTYVVLCADGENLNKMMKKGDACIFVGYSTQSRAYRVFNKRTRVIVESIHVNFDELPQMVSDHNSSDPAPECQSMALEQDSLSPRHPCQKNVFHADKTVTTSTELDLLFSPMFDELLNGSSKIVSKSSAVSTDAPTHRQQQKTTPLNNQKTSDPTCQISPQAPTVTSNENMNQAETNAQNDQVADDEFINIFSTPVQDRGETSYRH